MKLNSTHHRVGNQKGPLMQLAFYQITRKQNLKALTAKFQLKNQLSSYGLNPEEWRFQHFRFDMQSRSGKAVLVHRNDENLQISGKVYQEQISLKSLIKFRWEHLQWDL